MIIVANNDAVKWAMHKFLLDHGVRLQRSEDFQAIGRMSDATGDLIGVVAYNGFCGRVCSIHAAGDGNWVSREFIRVTFDYPFRQCDLAAVIAPVPGDNHKSLRFQTHMGFREAHRVTDGWAKGVDLILMEMRREDCRYIEVKSEKLSALVA